MKNLLKRFRNKKIKLYLFTCSSVKQLGKPPINILNGESPTTVDIAGTGAAEPEPFSYFKNNENFRQQKFFPIKERK